MTRRLLPHLCILGASITAGAGLAHGQAYFQEIPKVNGPGLFVESAMTSLSPDGSVAVGRDIEMTPSNFQATMWSMNTGLVPLDHLTSVPHGTTTGVSNMGQVIVGSEDGPGVGARAVMWDSSGAVTSLGVATPGDQRSFARGVSFNGDLIVGASGLGASSDDIAFRWTASDGMQSMGVPTGYMSSVAQSVSHDGSVIVGDGFLGGGAQGAWRWTESEGYQDLGTLGGPFPFTRAMGISGNGQVIIGNGFGLNGFEAFRWTEEDGMIGLGDLPGGTFSSWANGGVNFDGSIIVGGSQSGDAPSEAFIWDIDNGMRNLKFVLESEHGLDLTGWILEEAKGFSDDGLTISGWGLNPEGDRVGWVAHIPSPATAPIALLGLIATMRRRR